MKADEVCRKFDQIFEITKVEQFMSRGSRVGGVLDPSCAFRNLTNIKS
jgi:hypothetical protein